MPFRPGKPARRTAVTGGDIESPETTANAAIAPESTADALLDCANPHRDSHLTLRQNVF